jgi:hypothetical protein
MREVSIDLLQHTDISKWAPKISDLIFYDGILNRWWGIITGIKDELINIKMSGNLRLMVYGESKDIVKNVRKIKSASTGSYTIISNGVYYI